MLGQGMIGNFETDQTYSSEISKEEIYDAAPCTYPSHKCFQKYPPNRPNVHGPVYGEIHDDTYADVSLAFFFSHPPCRAALLSSTIVVWRRQVLHLYTDPDTPMRDPITGDDQPAWNDYTRWIGQPRGRPYMPVAGNASDANGTYAEA